MHRPIHASDSASVSSFLDGSPRVLVLLAELLPAFVAVAVEISL